jgi:ABC-type dipeptide/oligopeptide/nickel transport system ATPase component
MTEDGPLLTVRISAGYGGRKVLDDFRLEVNPGEIVGLVGESGSGKSTAALALMRLAGMKGARVDGEVVFGGRDLNGLSDRQLRRIRGREIAMVLQSPLTSLNPVLRIGTQLREAWRAHERGDRRREEAAFVEAMESVNLPGEPEFRRRYPSQLSVGQAQRVLIAMAVLHRPRLLIADEPTSALDMITQAEVLRLFGRLSRERAMAILYISHDLLSVASLCSRVAILERGSIVEAAQTDAIFQRPEHPYTRRLVESIPSMPDCYGDLDSLARATAQERQKRVADPIEQG